MVEEDGELDVVISKDLLDREKRKLVELKAIVAEKRNLVGAGGSKEERAGFRGDVKEASAAAKKQSKLVVDMKKQLRDLEKKTDRTR